MTPAAFIALLEQHDWYYERSDDNRAYAAGLKNRNKLLHLCHEQPELFRLYNHAENCIITGSPFNFQSVTGDSVKDEKQQHIHTENNAMKDLFQSFFDICIKPLIEAINNLKLSGLAAAGSTEAAAPAAEKPAKAPKALKETKPAPVPAEEEAPAPAAISEARVRATAKTLTKEAKDKLTAFLKKKYDVNSLGELPTEHYAAVHASILKIGGVDTDPDAPAPKADEVDITDME